METTKVFKKNMLAILHSILIIIALSSFSIFDNHQKQSEKSIDTICVVCGMKVDKSEAFTSKYKGKIYYFDSVDCKKTFEMNPQKFVDNKCVEKK
jgi:Cu+-exporting ATPase